MTFPAHMRAGSFELVLALGAFALVAGRIRPVLRRSAAMRPTPKSVKFDVREPGGSQMLDISVPAVIGRAREADLMILDPEVSRRHALCDVEAGVLYLTDLESSNGTFLNGKRIVESIELQAGDTIDMGNSRLTVLAVETS